MTTPVAAPDGSLDSGVAWHYGDPHAEQRALVAAEAVVDLSHLGVIRVAGPDRLSWLTDITTQQFNRMRPGSSELALILDPHGHVEYELHALDDGEAIWLIVEPSATEPVLAYLNSMKFMLRVEISDESATSAVVWRSSREPHPDFKTWLIPPDYAEAGTTDAGADRGGDASKYVAHRPAPLVGAEVIVPRDKLAEFLAEERLAGTWALEALRVAAAVPRAGLETDHRTLPHEVGWIGPAVHLNKGCYRGQEAVARVHNMGKPPRRLVLLHLDGSVETLPDHDTEVLLGEKVVGWIGTPARHYELGPIATAVIKRSVPVDAVLTVDGVSAAQEVVVTP